MKLKPWAAMPTAWIQEGGLHRFQWKTDGSTGTVALMIYYAMCQFAAPRPLRANEASEPPKQPPPPRIPVVDDVPLPWVAPAPGAALLPPPPPLPLPAATSHAAIADSGLPGMSYPPRGQIAVVPNIGFVQIPAAGWGGNRIATRDEEHAEITPRDVPDPLIARLTYDDLYAMTGRSRDRISAGIDKLIRESLIWRVDKSSTYGLCGSGAGKRWVKLPGRVLLSPGGTTFLPYTHFKLRSQDELNALKLHFYYAHTRDRYKGCSPVSYPTIQQKTGVLERDIPRANSFLISCGILQRTRGLPSEDVKEHESNKYYLHGYEDLWNKKA